MWATKTGDAIGPNLLTDAEIKGGVLRGATVVPWQVLQPAVDGAKGRHILFIDTCHSSNAYNPRLGNAAYHANIVAYTAARFDQMVREDDAWAMASLPMRWSSASKAKAGLGRTATHTPYLDYLLHVRWSAGSTVATLNASLSDHFS